MQINVFAVQALRLDRKYTKLLVHMSFKGNSYGQSLGALFSFGHTPSTAGTFRKKFRKNSGKTPETLSERFLEFPSRVRLGSPKPYNSRHLRLPERFQNSLPPSTAGNASFFRSGSGEGLSEPVMEFPAVQGVFLIHGEPLWTNGPESLSQSLPETGTGQWMALPRSIAYHPGRTFLHLLKPIPHVSHL